MVNKIAKRQIKATNQLIQIKASNSLCLTDFSRALLIMAQVNLWVGFSLKHLAGSN